MSGLGFLRGPEMAGVYQEAKNQGHDMPGVIPEICSKWTGSGHLLLLNHQRDGVAD